MIEIAGGIILGWLGIVALRRLGHSWRERQPAPPMSDAEFATRRRMILAILFTAFAALFAAWLMMWLDQPPPKTNASFIGLPAADRKPQVESDPYSFATEIGRIPDDQWGAPVFAKPPH